MEKIYKVLIGRNVSSLDRLFSYVYEGEDILVGERVLLPFGKNKEEVGFVLEIEEVNSIEEYEKSSNIKLAKIKSKIDIQPLLDDNLITLSKKIAAYYKCELISVISAFLPSALKPKKGSLNISTTPSYVDYVLAKETDLSKYDLTKRDIALFNKIKANKLGIKKSQLNKNILSRLLTLDLVEINQVPRNKVSEIEATNLQEFELTNKQQEVYDSIISGKEKEYLIEGVTGSGKTDIYIRIIQHYLKEDKGAIILVPEIALTDNLYLLLTNYFKENIAILNSSLSNIKKYEEYNKIANGETKIVLGTRSAIFAPVKNLSTIIIDEEHSTSYKQDSSPFYDARTVARFRSEIEGCKVIYGSATPQILTKAKAEKGLIKHLVLKERFYENQNKIHLIDLSKAENFDLKISSFFTAEVIDAIKKRIEKKEQTMILINRRGYSPIYICRDCHLVAKCENCNIPLVYHKKDDTLRCHYCGYKISKAEHKCICGSHVFTSLGYGTERAYEEIRFLFPQANIYRLDSDNSSNRNRHEVLYTFKQGEADILIGTQIIAKGHDFPKVTCAVIVDADNLLRIPTYLANEETFDLISQFVGRAGRNNKETDIYIQTYLKDNKIIDYASKQDYSSFYTYEMEERKKYLYPPYVYLVQLTLSSVNEKKLTEVSLDIKNLLIVSANNKRINIYGPYLPYVSKINYRYYRQFLIKYKSLEEMSPILDSIKEIKSKISDVSISINVDPGSE